MDKTQQGSDRNTPSVGSLNPVKLPKSDAERKPTDSEKLKEQPFTVKDERGISPIVPTNAPSLCPVSDGAGQSHPLYANVDGGPMHPTQMYAPETHGFYYGGYGNTAGEWDEYPYAHSEGIEMGSPGIYNENHSLVFHTGYGYSPQMPYGPYSPATTPVPTIRGDGQFYSTQQYPYTGPYYQQRVPPGMTYISPTPFSPVDSSLPFGMEQQDWSKPLDLQRSLTPLISPALSPQPVSTVGPFGHSAVSSVPGTNRRSSYGFGSSPNSFSGGYPHARMYHQGSPFSSIGIARGESWRGGRGSNSLCNCNSILDDVFTEQNKGPRATKPKTLNTDQNLSADAGIISSASRPDRELYNRQDFITDYKDAKFFIIKSYSEDNVHKSIKYGVWASTPNGNKKLDSAYEESREKGGCPVFLLFSVNASAQFCGVAEMIGPVDFDRSVDYWQQDKWSGQFPVKWHIIKDVPNGQFRHIVLENNDNKPVTNSRDTQEVKLEQGMEMLSIFKNYESDVSIIDDFDFYEERQKIMQERKSKLTKSPIPPPTSPYQNSTLPSNPVINQMSKTFANTLQLEENKKDQ